MPFGFNPRFDADPFIPARLRGWQRWDQMQWTATTTDPAIGNGTLQGWFNIDDRWLELWVEVVMGSTTTYGTGNWRFSGRPVPSAAPLDPMANVGWAGYRDTSGGANYVGPVLLASGLMAPRVPSVVTAGLTGAVTSSAPFTWASGDSLNLYAKFRYTE